MGENMQGTHKTLETSLDEINQWYVGWSNYYSLTYYPSQLKKVEAHIRRRLRSRIVSQQKRKQYLYRKLVKRGVPPKQASKGVFSNNKRWQLSNARAVTRAYPNSWFINLKGQEIRSDRKLDHWFEVYQWIRLTWGAVYGPVRTVLVCHESKKVLFVTVRKMEVDPPVTTSRSSYQTAVSCVD